VGLLLRPVGEFREELVGEDAGLHATQGPEPPEEGGDAVHEKNLHLAYGLQLGSQALAKLPQGLFILSRQQ